MPTKQRMIVGMEMIIRPKIKPKRAESKVNIISKNKAVKISAEKGKMEHKFGKIKKIDKNEVVILNIRNIRKHHYYAKQPYR